MNRHNHEDQRTEYKESWRDEYLGWVCAFANSEGGTVVVGLDDRGRAVGVPNADRLLTEIPNKARDLLGVHVTVTRRTVGDKELVEVSVERYPNPVSYRGEYHIRSGATKQVLRGAALDHFLLSRQGKTWDAVPVPSVNARGFSEKAMRTFVQAAGDAGRGNAGHPPDSARLLLERLHLLEGDRPLRAAVLLFDPEPERLFVGAYVKLGYFDDGGNLLYQDEIRGSLFDQVERAVDLLATKYLRAIVAITGLQRLETFPVPIVALREALHNAIVHRDYSSGAPIQIRVEDTQVVVWNPGVLPTGWTVERLFHRHPSVPRNPAIAQVFFRAGFIEAWGTGIERMVKVCKDAGTPEPKYAVDQVGVSLTLGFTAHAHATRQETRQEERQETRQETSAETTQERILAAIRGAPRKTQTQIAAQLGVSLAVVRYHIVQLRRKGRLLREGSTKAGRWRVLP